MELYWGPIGTIVLVMEKASSSAQPSSAKGSGVMTAIKWLLAVFLLLILADAFLSPVTISLRKTKESAAMETSRTIGLAMFQFANDHGGKYPTGHSSTEVFQQLIDGNYISDPAIFYVDMPGKSKAASNKLKPENVSWDVTVPLDSTSSEDIPLVFLTGYRVTYAPGGNAIPLFASAAGRLDGMAVCYHSNYAFFSSSTGGVPPSPHKMPNGVIANFVPTTFRANGQTFQQLTPDGPLPSAP